MAAPEANEGIDPDFVRQMIRDMEKSEWRPLYRAHQVFLRQSASFSDWTILNISGLPMAVWRGKAPETGTQLNVSLKDLTKVRLRFANLSKAALVGVRAEGASFRGAKLSHSVLTDSFMDGADFSLAKMSDVDMSRTSLKGAKFNKALLESADFQGCDLTGADFTGAELRGASFHDAALTDVIGFPRPIYTGDPAREMDDIYGYFSGWELKRQLDEFLRRHEAETLFTCMIDLLKNHPERFGHDTSTWDPLTSVAAAEILHGADFLRLVQAVAKGAPDGRVMSSPDAGGWTPLWNADAAIVGQVTGFHTMMKHKHEARDLAFFKTVLADYKKLPAPYRDGIAASLAAFGQLPLDAIPEAHAAEIAKNM